MTSTSLVTTSTSPYYLYDQSLKSIFRTTAKRAWSFAGWFVFFFFSWQVCLVLRIEISHCLRIMPSARRMKYNFCENWIFVHEDRSFVQENWSNVQCVSRDKLCVICVQWCEIVLDCAESSSCVNFLSQSQLDCNLLFVQ